MKKIQRLISFVIPVHNEAVNIQWHYDHVKEAFSQKTFNYEVIYVDDGSQDNSLEIVKNLAAKDTHIRYISFSRNFGKEAATTAGLQRAKGDAVIIMDGDGQHPLSIVDNFIEQWDNGYEVVVGIRQSNEGEGLVAKIGSRLFYSLLKSLDSNQEVISRSTDFRLIDRKVIDEFNKLTERNRITRNLIDWLGYKRAYIPFAALERHGGMPTYNFSKRFKLALDGMIKHSTKPLKFIGSLGVAISAISALTFVAIAVETYLLDDPLNLAITGTALLGMLLSFMCGVILSCQGLLALYLENVYHETQNRPLFIVSEET